MNLSLYALTDQFRELERIGTDETLDEGALEAIKNTLDGLTGSIEDKAVNVASYALNLDAYATMAKDASAKLAERARRIQKRAEHMREYIRLSMLACSLLKIEGPQFTISRKANPQSVTVFDLEKVPDDFRKGRDPIVDAIVNAARAAGQLTLTEDDAGPESIVISLAALELAIESQLPDPNPDKAKIATAIKDYEKAHLAAVVTAQKAGEPVPEWKDPVPGCRLDRGERLEVKA